MIVLINDILVSGRLNLCISYKTNCSDDRLSFNGIKASNRDFQP